MKLLLKRIAKRSTYTIGKLYIDELYFCDTLEDTDRGLSSDMALDKIKKVKVKNKTAIPTGTYDVNMNIISPKFSKKAFYQEVCNGRVPRLMNVPGFDGILIHAGSTADDSSGCILVGKNDIVGMVTDSRNTFRKLYSKLKEAKNLITITIQ